MDITRNKQFRHEACIPDKGGTHETTVKHENLQNMGIFAWWTPKTPWRNRGFVSCRKTSWVVPVSEMMMEMMMVKLRILEHAELVIIDGLERRGLT